VLGGTLLISIIIPAHNRPAFLLEAAQSIAAQTYHNLEVIVVDDGSMPPIEQLGLQDILGPRVRLHRNESAQGVPKAKNAGISLACGEVIMLLDDDDLLMPDALERIHLAFAKYPKLDCLFLGVQAFGPYADGPAKSRELALKKILDSANPTERDELYFFSDSLFGALLDTVPIDFQRPAARRGMWNIAGGFDESCLFSESAWAIHATCIGSVALTKLPLTRWRIHGNNFGWPPGLSMDQERKRQIDNGIDASQFLYRLFKEKQTASQLHSKMLTAYHSRQLFSKAYFLFDKQWAQGMRALLLSFLLAPTFSHVKLAIKFFLLGPLLIIRRSSVNRNNSS